MTLRRLAVLPFVLPFLASCGGGDSPTQPTAPPVVLGPAQPTIQIVVSQATLSTLAVESAGPAQQFGRINVRIRIGSRVEDALLTGVFVRMLIDIIERDAAMPISIPQLLLQPFDVPTGGERVFNFQLPLILDVPPLTGQLRLEMAFNYSDALGNTGQVTGSTTFDSALTVLPPGVCSPDAFTMCLDALSRWDVKAFWRSSGGAEFAPAPVLPPAFNNGGEFFFQSPNDPRLFVTLADRCAADGTARLLVAGTTSVEFNLSITDTINHITHMYTNPLGEQVVPYVDTIICYYSYHHFSLR